MSMFPTNVQGVLHIGASQWCWWFSIFTLWLWVLFFQAHVLQVAITRYVITFFFLLHYKFSCCCNLQVSCVILFSWSSSSVFLVASFQPLPGCGHFLVFLVALFLAMVIFLKILVASSYPLLWLWSSSCVLGCAPPKQLPWLWSSLCVHGCFFLAIIVVILLFSWLHSFQPSPWLWLSSCVLSCSPLDHCHGCDCSMVVVLLLRSQLFFSWPPLWSWSSSCVPSCAPPSHGHGHLLELLVVLLLTIALVLVIFLF